jgi:hypothetical protein
LGEGGHAGCGRCRPAPHAHYHQPFDIVAEVQAACEAWGDVPGPNVALTGPEPFGFEQLPDVVSAAVRAGVSRLRLDTDAVALGTGDNAAGVISAGVRHVRVTLFGGTPGVHDALAGQPGVLERTLQGMRQYVGRAEAAGVRVALSVRIPVCHHNVNDLPAAVTVAAEAGARHVLLEIDDAALDLRAAMPWIVAACDSGTVNATWVEVAGVPYCLAGEHALHLVPLLRSVRPFEKAARCESCSLDGLCSGVAEGTAPHVKAALAPPSMEKQLAESIRRAYLAPIAPGEGE